MINEINIATVYGVIGTLTPSILSKSVNAVDPGPRVFAHFAISQSIFDENRAQGFVARSSPSSAL
jgi:hypothetical protein